jgi:hypothetical protein
MGSEGITMRSDNNVAELATARGAIAPVVLAPKPGETSEADRVNYYVNLIRPSLGRSASALLEAAAYISAARCALDHAGFRVLAKRLGISAATLSKFVTIHSGRDRFGGREELMPSAWTVLYQVSKLPDGHFETLAASGKLRPELTEREVKNFVTQREAATPVARPAGDEMAYLAVKITFPALSSLEREDWIRQQVYAALGDADDLTVEVSDRKKLRLKRG